MKNNTRINSLKKNMAKWCCALGIAACSITQAQTYDAVADFSIANNNPNGAWSYGTLSTFTSGTFLPFNTGRSNVNFIGQLTWNNGGNVPFYARVDANKSGIPHSTGSVFSPINQLDLDGESFIADVRWIAPATGDYTITGFFQHNDTANGNGQVSVRIIENGTATLFSLNNSGQNPFDLGTLTLPVGTVVDFAAGGFSFAYDTTGLAVTIQAVPEPTSIALLILGTSLLVVCRRRPTEA
jgi:hypothetical protein